jgi:hypothetical protein
MMRPIVGGGLFGLGNMLHSLTASPFTMAVNTAHHMARRRLETGGSALPPQGDADDASGATEFELPPDIDPIEVALAIEGKMRGGRPSPGFADPLQVLERRAGGRVVVCGYHILRLGDGRFDRGRRFLHGLISSVRARRQK